MKIESSASIVRADIARLLIAFKLEPKDRIGATFDVIEYLAMGMRERSDIDVFNLALFVQRELTSFMQAGGCYPDTVDRLSRVAFAARMGNTALYRAMTASSHPIRAGTHRRSGL